MTTATLTAREELETMLPTFDEQNMNNLLKYAKFLRWSDIEKEEDFDDDEDTSWADLPLTPEEEEMLQQSREDAKNGSLLSLEEFLEGR